MAQSGRKKWWRPCLYVIYVAGVSALLFELGGRLVWVTDGAYLYPQAEQIFVFERELNYKLNAGYSISAEKNRIYPGMSIRVNGHHMRGKEPDAREAIVIVGDSVAFGFGVKEENTMSARLEHHLEGEFQVLNAGTPGYNMEQIALRTREVVNEVRPRTIVLLVNANDAEARYFIHFGGLTVKRFCTYPWEEGQYPPNFPAEVKVEQDPTDHWLLSSLARLFEGEWPVRRQLVIQRPRTEADVARYLDYEEKMVRFWNSSHPVAVERTHRALEALRELIEELTASGTRLVLARFPWSVTVLRPEVEDEIGSRWLELMQPGGGVAIDLAPVLQEAQRREPQFLPADGHPNAAGHETIALALKSTVTSGRWNPNGREPEPVSHPVSSHPVSACDSNGGRASGATR